MYNYLNSKTVKSNNNRDLLKTFESRNQEREAVKFKNLAKTQNGKFFYNTSRGSLIQKSTSVPFKCDDKHLQTV